MADTMSNYGSFSLFIHTSLVLLMEVFVKQRIMLTQLKSCTINKLVVSICMVCLLNCFTVDCKAQKYHLHNYTGDDGLSQLAGESIFQDRDGYIWIGTQAGLNRFDGYHFEIISIMHGLQNDWINAITQDSNGKIWVGTNDGLSSWLPQGIENYGIQKGLPDKYVNTVEIDFQNNVWCGTRAGLSKWDGTEIHNYLHVDNTPIGGVNSIHCDREGIIWIGSENGLYTLENNKITRFKNEEFHNKRVHKIVEDYQSRIVIGFENGIRILDNEKIVTSYIESDGLLNMPVTDLVSDRYGVIWVGSRDGVSFIENGIVKTITNKNGLPFPNATTIIEDRDGIIWVGGYGGVAKFLGRAFTNYKQEEGLGSNNIRPIIRDANNQLWVGTHNGLSRFDGSIWTNYTIKDGLHHDKIGALLEYPPGRIWIGTHGGLNYYENGRFYHDDKIGKLGRILYLALDHEGFIWFCVKDKGIFKQSSNGVEKIEVQGQLFSNARILVDKQGDIWCTGDYGLSKWNGISWRTYTTADGLAANEPYFLCEDKQDNIWFGYHSSHGVTRFDGINFKTFTTADGLFHDAVYSLGVDEENNLWIGTARGVDRFDGKTFINFSPYEGYASYESNAGGFFEDYDGTLWFGTARGLSHYNPRYNLSVGEPPIVKIHRLLLGGKRVEIGDVLISDYSQNDLQAHVVSTTYVNEKQKKLRYRLIGYDEDWKLLKGGQEITYTNLSPGSYTLEVQGSKYNSPWSDSAMASFKIKPPFWRSSWFLLLVIVGSGLVVFGIVKFRVYRVESLNRKLEVQVLERTAELRKQKSQLQSALRDRKKAEKEMEKAKNSYLDLFEKAPFGYQLIDVDGNIQMVNQTGAKMLGYSKDELLGKCVFDFLVDGISYQKSLEVEIENKQSSSGKERKYKCKNGAVLDIFIKDNLLLNESGNVIGIRSTMQDLAEQKKAEKKLETYAQELKRSNSELQDFANVASHDLQEPLRKIQVFGERLIMKYGELIPDQGKDYLARMQNAAKRMNSLLNGLLHFARVTTKAKPFETVDLSKIASEAASDLETRIEQTSGKVEIGELPVIDADSMQIRQLFQNLIGNGLKFHRQDVHPIVKINGQKFTTNGNGRSESCKITVEDNGIGFDEKDTGRIFGVFQRLHRKNEFEGTGIGLAICQKIVERHSGKISAQSTLGKGTKFIVDLPVKQLNGNH